MERDVSILAQGNWPTRDSQAIGHFALASSYGRNKPLGWGTESPGEAPEYVGELSTAWSPVGIGPLRSGQGCVPESSTLSRGS